VFVYLGVLIFEKFSQKVQKYLFSLEVETNQWLVCLSLL